MSYREFNDESGVKWGVWFVSPMSAERRSRNRREVNVEAASGDGDRRTTADRRRHPSRSRSAVAPGYEKGWLCFESERGEKRRLTQVPENWEEGSADQLRIWLEEAIDSSKCRPL